MARLQRDCLRITDWQWQVRERGGHAPRPAPVNRTATVPGVVFPVAEAGISGAVEGMQAVETNPRERASRTAWIWPVAWAGVIFAASSRAQVVDVNLSGLDKLVHLLVYGLLGVLCCRLGRSPRSAVLAVLVVSAYGATDEWHQSFVPSRSAEAADWVADTLGAALAVAGYTGSPRLRHGMEFPARLWRRVWGRRQPVSTP
jgi:hypothetical protein